MQEEIWKDVPGYKGKYKVSNLGNVKSLSRNKSSTTIHGIVFKRIYKEKILKKYIGANGYYIVTLYNKNAKNKFLVHRLVFSSFVGRIYYKNDINHKDFNRLNNNINNLESVSRKKNILHSLLNGRYLLANKKQSERMKLRVGILNHLSKPVLQYDLQGNFIKEWINAREINNKLKICYKNISACCLEKQKTAYGFKWKYK